MANIKQTSNAKKGGLFVGKSHAEGGIPAIVTDTGQPIEVEGGEAIINKEATALHWEELSKINQSAGNGVPIPPPDEADKILEKFETGGKITPKEKQIVYNKWKKLVNMTYTELSRYYHSKDGKDSGLTESEAKEQGISSGRESAEWILKMKKLSYKSWTEEMWKWANKQISFISRMSGIQGDLTDAKGNKTRKYKALLIWGNNPKKKNAPKFETGGTTSPADAIKGLKALLPISSETEKIEIEAQIKNLSEPQADKLEQQTKSNQEYIDYLVELGMIDGVELRKLYDFLIENDAPTTGLLPEKIRLNPEYRKLKSEWEIASKKPRPKFKYPANRDRVQEQNDRKKAFAIVEQKIQQIIDLESQTEKFEQGSKIKSLKEKQLEIIKSTNPAPNEYNTWIRTLEDIKTAEEVFSIAFKEGAMYPDFETQEMTKAIESGYVTIFSSYPIKKGVFVTPSKINALEYAGGKNGKIFSKKVKIKDVAWIDESEGQYAPTETFEDGGNVDEAIEFYERTYTDGTKTRFSIEEYENNIAPNLDIHFDKNESTSPKPEIYENNLLQIRVIGGANSYYRNVNKEWKFLTPEEIEILENGRKHEMEHSETISNFKRKDIPIDVVATFIAYDHINEDANYYKKLDIAIPEKMAEGKKIEEFPEVVLEIYANNEYYRKSNFTEKALIDVTNQKVKFTQLDTGSGNFRIAWKKVYENSNGYYIDYDYFGGRIFIKNWYWLCQENKPEKMEQGKKISGKTDSLRYFVENQLSSGMLSSGTELDKYVDLDNLRSIMLEMLSEEEQEKEYSIPYSSIEFELLKKQALNILKTKTPKPTKKYSLAKLSELSNNYLVENNISKLFFIVSDLSNNIEESYLIEPTTYKQTSYQLDGMQILWNSRDNEFEVSEVQAGKNADELWVYGTYKELNSAINSLLKGNSSTGRKRNPKFDESGIRHSYYENKETEQETPNLSTPPQSLSTPPQSVSTPPIEEIKQIPMEENQINYSASSVSNWNEIPVRWKNVKAVLPITFNLNPYDKGLNSIVKVLLGSDPLRPIMSTIHFADKGLVVTDAHKLLHIAFKNSDFKGNYATQNTLDALKGSQDIKTIEKATEIIKNDKYPNWEAVIPRENPFVYEIDTMKLYQYTKVALNYSNKTTNQVAFKYADGRAIGFNGKFLIESLEALMKIQKCPKVYIHLSEPSRAGLISFEKSITATANTYVLLMPVVVNSESTITKIYGAKDLDWQKELNCYFDFTDNEIHNANGTIADYKESYGDSQLMPLAIITMLDKFIKSSKNAIAILDNVCVDANGIRVSKLSEGMIEIANDWNIPQGLYTIQKNAFMQNTLNGDISEFPKLLERVSTKEPVFTMDTEVFKFYVSKASEHIGDDDLRPVLKSILFQKIQGTSGLEIVSTNAVTLFHANISKYAENVKAEKLRFQIGEINLLMNFVKNIETEKVHLYINDTNYRIDAGRTHFESRLEDGKYPNWEAVTPIKFSNELSFNIKDLFDCVNNSASKMFMKEEEIKKDSVLIFNQNDKIFIAKNIKEVRVNREPEPLITKEICEMKISKTTFETPKMFDSNLESFILLMPQTITNGNYFNFNLQKLTDVFSTIGKEKVIANYNELSTAYIFTSDNLHYRTADVYKPIKTVTKKAPTEKLKKEVVAKQVISVPKPVAPKLTPEAMKVIPKHQLSVLRSNNFSEFEDAITRLNMVLARVPKLYGQDSVKDKVIYLHYFYGNQDWYVTELDKSTGECFGYANLGYGAELGYMSIPEFVANGKVELDFYFEPQVWSSINKSEKSAFEKQNVAPKSKPVVAPTSKLTPEEESELLAEKLRKYLKENGVDEISQKLKKQLFDFNKKHFLVTIKLYIQEVGYGSDRSTKPYGEVDFHKISGWIDDKPFTKVIDGKIVNNDLGQKIGRKLAEGGGSAFFNFTPTLENALIIQQEYEKNGYKTIVKNQLPVLKSKQERSLKNKQPLPNDEISQAIKGLEAFLRTSNFSARNPAKTQVEQAIKGLKALLK